MHPELTAALAAEHRRDLTADMTAHPTTYPIPRPRRPRTLLPRYRLTWTHTTLGAMPIGSGASGSASPAAAGPRGRSWVIVISATRPL